MSSRGRQIGANGEPTDGAVELLVGMVEQAIADAREDEYIYWSDALRWLNSEDARYLCALAGVEMPSQWNRKNVRHPRYRRYRKEYS